MTQYDHKIMKRFHSKSENVTVESEPRSDSMHHSKEELKPAAETFKPEAGACAERYH